jgi:hypothetical protein
MTTDFTTHPPKKDYTATLKITGTKADFQELYNFIESSELREIRDSKVFDEVLNELHELIAYMEKGEQFGGL